MSAGTARPLERGPTTQLARDLAQAVAHHFLRRPTSSDSVYEVLNALGCVAAHVIAGTGADAPKSRKWLDLAIDQQLMGEEQGHG